MADSELKSRELFELSQNSFESTSEFVNYLSSEETEVNSELNIIFGVHDSSDQVLLERFKNKKWTIAEDHGAVKRIQKQYSEDRCADGYLAIHSDSGHFQYYTNQSKTKEVSDGIDEFLRSARGVTYLYIPPQALLQLAERAEGTGGSSPVDRFIAKSPSETFNYYGGEGMNRLDELHSKFGVYPHNIVMSTSGLNYRIDTKGRVKLKHGDLDDLMEQIGPTIDKGLDIKTAHDSSSSTTQTFSEGLDIRVSKPAVMEFDEKLEYGQVSDLQSTFDQADSSAGNDYTLLDYYAEPGSVFLSGTVYDGGANTSFKIRGDEDRLRILPTEEQEPRTLFGFVEFLQSEIKADASIVVKAEEQ